MTIPANYNYVDSVYNVKSLTDYFVLNAYTLCLDWLIWNTEWWRGLDTAGTHKKWGYGLWMKTRPSSLHQLGEISGHFYQRKCCDPQSMGDPGGQGHVPILNALLTNPTFHQYYVSRFIDLSNTYFKCTYMQHVLDSIVTLMTPEMPAHITRWGGSGGSMTEWQNNVASMKKLDQSTLRASQSEFDNCYSTHGPYN